MKTVHHILEYDNMMFFYNWFLIYNETRDLSFQFLLRLFSKEKKKIVLSVCPKKTYLVCIKRLYIMHIVSVWFLYGLGPECV